MPSLAQEIRTERLAADLRQQDLAERAGVPISTLRDLEQGRVQRPRKATVERLKAALSEHSRSLNETSTAVGNPAAAHQAPTESAAARQDGG